MRVQQLMRLVAAGLAEELVIQLLERRVLVRFAELLAAVLAVKRGGAQRLGVAVHQVLRGNNRLTAARDTAARGSPSLR